MILNRPDGWEKGWAPDLKCEICGEGITDVYRRAVMKGSLGIETYPVHSKCGEEMANRPG